MNFFISDLHFGHFNVIHYADRPFLFKVNDCAILFNNKIVKTCITAKEAESEARLMSLKLMEETMIQNWNNKVSNKDTVYIGGDFAFCGIDEIKRLLSLLNGKKILIEGNHDKSKKTMLEAGFDEVHETLEISIDKYKIVLNHYPFLDPEFNHIAELRPNIIKINSSTKILPTIPDEFNYNDSREFLLKKYSHPINLSLDKDKKVLNYFKRAISTHIGTRLINDGRILVHGHTHKSLKRFANMINISVEAWDYTPASENDLIIQIEEFYNEINAHYINDINCEDPVYQYYQKLNNSLSIFKEIKEVTQTLKRVKKSKEDPIYKSSGSPPKNYSKKWYDINVQHNMFIPKHTLIKNHFYEGYCRNANWAYWDGDKFYHYRTKFGSTYIEAINCMEDDNGFDVFVPYELKILSEEEKTNFLSDLQKTKNE